MKVGDKVIDKSSNTAHFIALVLPEGVVVRDSKFAIRDESDFELIYECTEEEHIAMLEGMIGMSDQNDLRVIRAKFLLSELRKDNAEPASE